MRSLIITVAGMSSRFNRDLDNSALKCLYYEENPSCSLLSMQISKAYDFVDEIIVIGGYKYDDLTAFIAEKIKFGADKIKTIFNEHYHDYGSGYSLIKGLDAVSKDTEEIAFIEGDLFFDAESIKDVLVSKEDVISINNEPILSNKAVALYFDAEHHPHYIYDISHSCLEIHEPFTAIYNSGQVWKFMNSNKVRDVRTTLTPAQEQGTNLEIIQKYFGTYTSSQLNIVRFNIWFNCNTVADYREAIKTLSK